MFLEPFLVSLPHFDKAKSTGFRRRVEDVKEYTFGFTQTSLPARAKSCQERFNVGGINADGYVEGHLPCGLGGGRRRHGDGSEAELDWVGCAGILTLLLRNQQTEGNTKQKRLAFIPT